MQPLPALIICPKESHFPVNVKKIVLGMICVQNLILIRHMNAHKFIRKILSN